MQKAKSVVDFLAKCQKLSDTIRTGWDDWHVNRERLESIAEHIFEVAIFTILMKSQYEYDVDIMKVVYMVVIHDLGEIEIGDYTPFQITREEKTRIERAAVHDMLKDLLDGPEIEALFLEFDAHETDEAILAYQCDKAIACLKSKWYDEEGCVVWRIRRVARPSRIRWSSLYFRTESPGLVCSLSTPCRKSILTTISAKC